MTSLVVAQMTVRCKSYSANKAFVWLHPIVDPIVDFKIASFGEKFAANFAFERLDALVSADVDLKAPCPRVCLVAEWAFKR